MNAQIARKLFAFIPSSPPFPRVKLLITNALGAGHG